MEKCKLILKNFFGIIFVDIFFLGTELIAAYIEGKPIKIISSINISCFVILLILTIIRLIRKDYEISMYSALLLFGCSLSWVIPVLLYGSIFGKNTGIITGILYVISIGIGILIPVIQGKVDRRKTFWVIIEKIAITAATIMVSVLIVLGRIFRGKTHAENNVNLCHRKAYVVDRIHFSNDFRRIFSVWHDWYFTKS